MFKLTLLVFFEILVTIFAYPTGAPDSACVDMFPHHATPEQTTEFPYNVSANPIHTTPNGIVQITLSGAEPFKGFLIEVRDDHGIAVGSFKIPPLDPFAKPIDCFNKPNSAATHPDNMLKNNIVLQWQAPAEPGTYQIYVTIVRSYKIFWSAQKGDKIIVQ